MSFWKQGIPLQFSHIFVAHSKLEQKVHSVILWLWVTFQRARRGICTTTFLEKKDLFWSEDPSKSLLCSFANTLKSKTDLQFIFDKLSVGAYVIAYINETDRKISDLQKKSNEWQNEFPNQDYPDVLKRFGMRFLDTVEMTAPLRSSRSTTNPTLCLPQARRRSLNTETRGTHRRSFKITSIVRPSTYKRTRTKPRRQRQREDVWLLVQYTVCTLCLHLGCQKTVF